MLPNLIIIGAQKAGTSSLHHYLGLHPEISMSRPKELNFFSGPGWSWERGLDWYESHFAASTPVRGEASPSYAAYPLVQGAPDRMSAVVPNAKLIYLVRDPVERMVSRYVHQHARGQERRAIAELFADERFALGGYVAQSRYHMQLERYLPHYDRSRILVVDHHDLLRRRAATLQRVFRFLGVDEGFTSPRFAELRNPGYAWRRRPVIDRALRVLQVFGGSTAEQVELALVRSAWRPAIDLALAAELRSYFAHDAAHLRELTGERFESWSV